MVAVYELSLSLVDQKDGFSYDMYTTVYYSKCFVENYNKIKDWRDPKKEEGWFAVGITFGLAAVDMDHAKKAKRESTFPLALTDEGVKFKSREGEASVKQDKLDILAEIGDRNTMLDEKVHSVVAASALERVLNDGSEQQQQAYIDAIRKCSPQELRLKLTGNDAHAQARRVCDALAAKDECKTLELLVESMLSLPDSIIQLTALMTLNLGLCSSLVSLPEGISGLTALKTLNLEHCSSLVSLPEGISGLTALEMLNLQWCRSLVSLPEGISSLTALKTL